MSGISKIFDEINWYKQLTCEVNFAKIEFQNDPGKYLYSYFDQRECIEYNHQQEILVEDNAYINDMNSLCLTSKNKINISTKHFKNLMKITIYHNNLENRIFGYLILSSGNKDIKICEFIMIENTNETALPDILVSSDKVSQLSIYLSSGMYPRYEKTSNERIQLAVNKILLEGSY